MSEYQSKEQAPLVVIATASEEYTPFILPFICSTLHFNPSAAIEILVESPSNFTASSSEALTILDGLYPGKVVVREHDFTGIQPSVARFIVTPRTRASYVYFSDIDILCLEEIMPGHLAHMKKSQIRYSNVVRKNFETPKLTGLHFSEFSFHFPVTIPSGVDLKSRSWGFDEDLLYKIVASHVRPSLDYAYRPIHGFHLSYHGWPLSRSRGWGVQNEKHRASYASLSQIPLWGALKPHFDARFQVVLRLLDASVQALAVFTPRELLNNFCLSGRDGG